MKRKKLILPAALVPLFLVLILTLLFSAFSFAKPVASALLTPNSELPISKSSNRLPTKLDTPSTPDQATLTASDDAIDSPMESSSIAVRVYFSDPEELSRLAGLIDIWHVQPTDGYFVAQLFSFQMEWVKSLGFRVELDEERTAHLRELDTIKYSVQSASQAGGIPGFPCYRTVEETYADMIDLAAENPTLASWIDIGDSWNKINYAAVTGDTTPPVVPPDLALGYDLHALVLTNSDFTPTATTVTTNVVTNTVSIPVTQTVMPTSMQPLTTQPLISQPLTDTTVVTSYVPITTTTIVPKPSFFLLATIHARELTPAETATRFAEKLVAEYGVDPDVTWLLDYNQIHIVPIGNPDGRKFAEQLESWRKNTNTTDSCLDPTSNEPLFPRYGVDLNRNSSFQWNMCEGFSCSSNNSCSDTYRGSAPASEPETVAIESYIRSLFADRRGPQLSDAAPLDTSGLMISMHSYSELILYPWGFRESAAPNGPQLRTLAAKFGYITGYRSCQSGAPGCIYQTDGTTDDWSYGELGVSSFTFELGTRFFESCGYFEETVLDEALPSLLYAAKSARLPYQLPSGPEIVEIGVAPLPNESSSLRVSVAADDTRFDSNGPWIEPTQPISGVRYSIDSPPWITGTVIYTMTAVDASLDEPIERLVGTIDTSGLSDERHTLFVQGQDADGNWGVASSAFFRLPTKVNLQIFMPFLPHFDLE